MRIESNHARGTFQQLRVALLRGLTCKLYSLYGRIESIKSELEVHRVILLVSCIADDSVSAGGRQATA
jgi:hypothetical protein